jgi:hypothetical protein
MDSIPKISSYFKPEHHSKEIDVLFQNIKYCGRLSSTG